MIQPPTYEMVGDDLVLLEDTRLTENLVMKGDIYCKDGKYALTVRGDIFANNISVGNIDAINIDAHDIIADDIDVYNIHAHGIVADDIDVGDIEVVNIDARNIKAFDINANTILCEKRIKKTPDAKTFAKSFIQNKSELEFKEQMPLEEKA